MYRRQRYTSLPDRYVAPAICTASLTDMKQGRYVAPQAVICSALGAISAVPCPNAVLAAEASSKRGTARTGSTSRCAASRSTAAPAATPRGGRRRISRRSASRQGAGRTRARSREAQLECVQGADPELPKGLHVYVTREITLGFFLRWARSIRLVPPSLKFWLAEDTTSRS